MFKYPTYLFTVLDFRLGRAINKDDVIRKEKKVYVRVLRNISTYRLLSFEFSFRKDCSPL